MKENLKPVASKNQMVTITLRVPIWIREKFIALAQDWQMNPSPVYRKALEFYLEKVGRK